jgi:GMP synthase PP-ATPase subunit
MRQAIELAERASAAAMVHARLERVMFGASDQQFGAAGSALSGKPPATIEWE